MEFLIFNLIKIDLLNLIKIKAKLAKEFHIQPSEIDKMQVWEYELFITYLNEAVKEDNEAHEDEMSKYNINKDIFKNPNKFFKQPQSFKLPKY